MNDPVARPEYESHIGKYGNTEHAPVTYTPDLDAPSITTRERCLECDGEGHVMVEKQGGTWNTHIGTWEPDEYQVDCDVCDRTGFVTATRCPRCGLLHDNDEAYGPDVTSRDPLLKRCDCTPDELEAWEARMRSIEQHVLAMHAQRERLKVDGLSDSGGLHGLTWNELHALAARHGTRVTYFRDRPKGGSGPFISTTLHGIAIFGGWRS